MAMSEAFEYCINVLCANGNITISLQKEGENAVISIHCKGTFNSEEKLDNATNSAALASLIKVLKPLNGKVEINPLKDTMVLFFLTN